MPYKLVLVRVDGCDSYYEATEIALTFGYKHSSEGVYHVISIPLPLESFLNILEELEPNKLEYTTESLRLLLECDREGALSELKAALTEIMPHFRYHRCVLNPEKSVYSKLLSDIIEANMNKNPEIIRHRNLMNIDPYMIDAVYKDLDYKENLLIMKFTIALGYEDWDFFIINRQHNECNIAKYGISNGRYNKNFFDPDIFKWFADANQDTLKSDLPSYFFNNDTIKTFYIILNVHE